MSRHETSKRTTPRPSSASMSICDAAVSTGPDNRWALIPNRGSSRVTDAAVPPPAALGGVAVGRAVAAGVREGLGAAGDGVAIGAMAAGGGAPPPCRLAAAVQPIARPARASNVASNSRPSRAKARSCAGRLDRPTVTTPQPSSTRANRHSRGVLFRVACV
jgi:hypothetical protein